MPRGQRLFVITQTTNSWVCPAYTNSSIAQSGSRVKDNEPAKSRKAVFIEPNSWICLWRKAVISITLQGVCATGIANSREKKRIEKEGENTVENSMSRTTVCYSDTSDDNNSDSDNGDGSIITVIVWISVMTLLRGNKYGNANCILSSSSDVDL